MGAPRRSSKKPAPKEDSTDIATGEINVTAPVRRPSRSSSRSPTSKAKSPSRFDVHANPTFFVIDENGLIRYRGVLETARSRNTSSPKITTSPARLATLGEMENR